MRLLSPIATFDFQIEKGLDLQEAIEAVIRDCQPEGTQEVGISFGAKDKGGPVHCFVEFYDSKVTTLEPVISEDMRMNGEPE